MSTREPLTKADLVQALKGFREAVRKDMQDIVHRELTEFHANITQSDIEGLRQEMRIGFKGLDR